MSRILAAAFFDETTLIGVRLEKAEADDPVETFASVNSAALRPALAEPKHSGCMVTALIALGMVVTLVGGSALLSTCHDGANSTAYVPPALTPPPAPPPPPIRMTDARETDCDGGSSWRSSLASLDAKLEPRQAAWKPWFTRTLLRVPQTDPASWQTPRADPGDARVRDAALALAEAFAAVDSAPDTAVVLDLPGPQSVAAAGALADRFEPVFTFDNIPDGAGVVPAQDTLGAVLYWLPRLLRGAEARGDKAAAPVFVLDANRLNPYRNEADRFDNRYRAKLPTAAALKAAGVKRALYVRPQAGAVSDSDDLNETLADWRDAGIEVKALGLSALAPVAAPAPPTTDAPNTTTSSPPAVTHIYHHYYGDTWAPYFWRSYGWYSQPAWPVGPPLPAAPLPDDSAWGPSRRTGLFSGLSAPPPGGARRPPPQPPSSSYGSGGSSSGGHSSYSGGGSSRPSSSSPGGSWGRSSGGSSFG